MSCTYLICIAQYTCQHASNYVCCHVAEVGFKNSSEVVPEIFEGENGLNKRLLTLAMKGTIAEPIASCTISLNSFFISALIPLKI